MPKKLLPLSQDLYRPVRTRGQDSDAIGILAKHRTADPVGRHECGSVVLGSRVDFDDSPVAETWISLLSTDVILDALR